MMTTSMKRRDVLLKALGAGAGLAGLSGCVARVDRDSGAVSVVGAMNAIGKPDVARVLVVGGGYGGATAAKYVRLLSQYKIEVVLVEPDAAFVSCPMSNLVLGGSRTIADVTRPYATLEK